MCLNLQAMHIPCISDLKRQRIRIGARDLRISAIALSINGIVVTRNQRDFRQVSGLQLEDWTVEN